MKMKNVMIVVLLLVILGLWFYTDATKKILTKLGEKTKERGEEIGDKVIEKAKDRMEKENLTEENRTEEEINS